MILDLISKIEFWSALFGLIGTVILYFFGISLKIDEDGHQNLITEQTDEKERIKYKKYKRLSNLGLFFIALSFLLQIINLIKI